MPDYDPTEIDALVPPDLHPPNYQAAQASAEERHAEEAPTFKKKVHFLPGIPSALPRLFLFIALFILSFFSLLTLFTLLLSIIHPAIGTWLPPHRSSTALPLVLSFLASVLSLSSLLTVDAPSILTRIGLAISLGFTTFDLLLILCVEQLRTRESWLGGFVLGLIILTLLTAYGSSVYVEAVHHEAERARTLITAEEANNRASVIFAEGGYWGKRWRKGIKIGIAFIIASASAGISFLIALNVILSSYDASLSLPYPTSQLLSIKPAPARYPFRVHLACTGHANNTVPPSLLPSAPESEEAPFFLADRTPPTMVYESMSGIPGTTGGEWIFRLAEEGVGRACIWDRPGYGFSDNSPAGSDVPHVTAALWSALEAAGEKGPYMLIGAGYGGLISRYFATMHPEATHSILYVESQHPSLFYEPPPPSSLPDFWRHVISPLGLTRLGDLLRANDQGTRWWRTVGPAHDGLLKARLDERLQAHRRDSISSLALNSTYTDYPFRTPTIVLSSRDRIDTVTNWQRVQRDIWSGAVGKAKVAWRIVKEAGHDFCKGLRGEGECRRAIEELLIL